MFQSTHPGWGATALSQLKDGKSWVSIHAPRVGCDKLYLYLNYNLQGFQSTHPGWGATDSHQNRYILRLFQSTHPGWGATSSQLCCLC